VPGETTAFHLRFIKGNWWPVVEWRIGDETASCAMVDEGHVAVLVGAVNAGKSNLGAPSGGAFLIDEYGRVLVPASDRDRLHVTVVAECTGPLRFHDVFSAGEPFDLYDDRGLRCGDPWNRPCVGLGTI